MKILVLKEPANMHDRKKCNKKEFIYIKTGEKKVVSKDSYMRNCYKVLKIVR